MHWEYIAALQYRDQLGEQLTSALGKYYAVHFGDIFSEYGLRAHCPGITLRLQ